jgi:outer membrane receptor protein involved in Fe transport
MTRPVGMLRPLALVLALLALAATRLPAQVGVLTGTVVDEGGAPLANAQVFVMGTQRGTRTDQTGRFQIGGLAPGEYRIEVRQLNYRTSTQQVQVGSGANNLSVRLAYSPLSLDAVVVTGQGGEISKRRLSTNVEVVSEEQIKESPANRLDQLLQGALPNVQVRLGSGQPGATSTIRGRGPVSVSRATTPVIYVDGVRVDNLNTQAELSLNTSGNRAQGTQTSSIADIPLENIEHIEYIAGGAATTLYGSDAANGVIQIFTNKGKAGRSQFSVESEVGTESVDKRYFYFPQTAEILYKSGLTQQYRMSGSGGSENATWSVSGSVQDRDGYRIANNASRSYQGRTGLSANISSTVNYEGSFGFGWNSYQRSRDGNAGGYTPLWLLEGGRIFAFGFNNDLTKLTPAGYDSLQSFVDKSEALQNFRVEVARFETSQVFNWRPSRDLKFRGLLGLDNRQSNERGIVTNAFLIQTQQRPVGTDDRGTISNYDRNFLGLSMEASGQYTFERGPLSLINSVGSQLFRNDDRQASRVATNVREGSETVRGAGSVTADDFFSTLVNYGVYAQQNWGFYSRYFLDLGLRADGNSAFGNDVGTQYYPKIGLSYDIGRESFFESLVPSGLLSNLRLRANYGVAGNFPPPFARDRTVAFNSYLGGQVVSFGQPGDPSLRPEKTSTLEVGAEAEALDSRLTLQFSAYDARTRDALMLAPSVSSSGESPQLHNVGKIKNTGLEFRLGVDAYRSDNLLLHLGGAINTLHNVVTSTGGSPAFQLTGFGSSTIETVVEEGKPVGFLRGSKATINPDGTLGTVERLAYLGKPLPDRFGTLSMSLTVHGNLKLDANADWQQGAQMHSFNRQFRYFHGLSDPELPAPILALNRSVYWLDLTNEFVEDADYLKIRAIVASYTVPTRYRTAWMRGLELSMGVQNPYGWWTSSFDPESDTSGATSQGGASVGGFNYAVDPAPRRLTGTVRVRF